MKPELMCCESRDQTLIPILCRDNFNPIPAGVLENQDTLGGYIIRKLLCSTFIICQKIVKFAKIEFFIAKSSFIVKMFAKNNLPKKCKIIHF